MQEIIYEFLQNKNFLMFASAISYVLGLFAYFTERPIWFGFIFTILSLLLILKKIPYKIVLIWIIIFYIGFLNASLRIKNYDTLFKLAPANATIYGQIISVPNGSSKSNSKFFFKVKNIVIDGKKYTDINNKTLVGINDFSSKSDFSKLIIGNNYEIKGKLRRPFVSTNPSQFSYAGYLRNFNTYTTFYAQNKDIQLTDSNLSFKWKLMQYLNKKRDNIIKSHSQYINSPYIDILGGVIFGDDAISPPDYIKTSFIHSGLLHILAASGLNVAFISSFLFFFMIRLKVPYRIQMLIGILATIFYCMMTGLGASVIRAGLMLIFILFGKLIDRDAHSIALLSFVGMLMLIYNPAYINDVGFQLSFIVTLGLLLSIELVISYTKQIPQWLSASIFIPVIAQIWVVPIQMFYFNTISIYSVFANILTMPFLAVISFGGFISSIFALYSPISSFVCKWFDIILKPCLVILVNISDFISKLPHSLYYTTHPNIVQILLYYAIVCSIIYLVKTNFKYKKLKIATIILTIILFLSATIHISNNNLEVIAFDVGNADAFLMKTPKNKYFIIDTGKSGYNGGKSQAEIIILKYLRDIGIKDIEGLIITHFDSDHSGGAVDLIKSLNIKNVYVNSTTNNKRIAKQIYKASKEKQNTSLVLSQNNKVIYKEPNLKITTLKADIPQHGRDTEANENSIMNIVEHNKMTILFTGDAGVRAFNQVKNHIPRNITILKTGHHGAKNVVDKNMLEYLNPKFSLISVGYNKYGHPHPLVIKLLSCSTIIRTDKNHAIKIVSGQKGYEIDNYDSKNKKFHKKYKIIY